MPAQRPLFFVGLHKPQHADQFTRSMVSVNRLEIRRSDFYPQQWILDSGAFSRLTTGRGHMPVEDYAAQVRRWARCGQLVAAVAQDWMCERFVLEKTGLSVAEHQARTLSNWYQLRKMVRETYVLPVLQGYTPSEYVRHVHAYGEDLAPRSWVGVGSVCKRNGTPAQVLAVLRAIKAERPDLRLHGFGLKLTALAAPGVADLLYSCDSMAWSSGARWHGRDANSPAEAHAYVRRVAGLPQQGTLPL